MREMKKTNKEIPITKICYVGSGLYEGHKDRRIYIPSRNFVVRMAKEDRLASPIFDIKRDRNFFSYNDTAKQLDDALIPKDELEGKVLHTLGSAPYRWTQYRSKGLAKHEEVDDLIEYVLGIRKEYEFRKRRGEIETDVEGLRGLEDELGSPDFIALKKLIEEIRRKANSVGKSHAEQVGRYLFSVNKTIDLYKLTIPLFNKIWRRKK